MNQHYDLVIVGAGPAGMAAAGITASAGLDVLLLDEQPLPGGQIYRNVGAVTPEAHDVLGGDYSAGRVLTDELDRLVDAGKLEYVANASVWNLEPGCEIAAVIEDRSVQIHADRVLICSGAQERPMPIPGWQLPGVMTAGAAQILLKTGSLVADGNVVLAGSGPLLGLLCTQYVRAGVTVDAVIDTTPRSNRWRSLRHAPAALLAPEYLYKGFQMWRQIRLAGIPVFRNVSMLRAEGDEALESIRFVSRGREHVLPASSLFLHNGVVPQFQLGDVAGCKLRWSERQQCWQVATDATGATSVEGIFVAGDGGAIGGAEVAALEGSLVARHLVEQSGARPSFELKRKRGIRPFLDTLFHPGAAARFVDDDTLVCRCEEVTVGDIRAIAARGCQGPNQAKSFSRAGMGPCQGRQCSLSVAALIAESHAVDVASIEPLRSRPPVRPVTLEQMAGPQ